MMDLMSVKIGSLQQNITAKSGGQVIVLEIYADII